MNVDPARSEFARTGSETIESRYFEGTFTLSDWQTTGHLLLHEPGAGRYVTAILSHVDVGAIRARRFRVVLDSGNGAACMTSPLLLERLGAGGGSPNGPPPR